MMQGKTLVIVLVTLIIGFAAGFILRPVIAPPHVLDAASLDQAPMTVPARSTQYFASHVHQADQVLESCREGSVRGDECNNAEAAVIKVEAQKRAKKFMGN